jgi:hypothetical protein
MSTATTETESAPLDPASPQGQETAGQLEAIIATSRTRRRTQARRTTAA